MANLLHVTMDAESPLGAALRLRANREGLTVEQVVQGILRKVLAAELDEVAGVLPLAKVIQHVIQAGCSEGREAKDEGRGARGAEGRSPLAAGSQAI